MKVNIQWLRDWVDIEVDADALADELTTAGLEVDAVLPAAPPLDGVVVARIAELTPHPNADRLSLCIVDDGEACHEVVCGAPNAAAGLAVPFAPVGARLPGGRLIEATEFRGVISNGMLCSPRELELSDDASGLLILDGQAPPGTPLVDWLELDDSVLDIDLTPNRGDCFSVIGIAREVAASGGRELSGPDLPTVPAAIEDTFEVELENAHGCPRFAGRVIRNLRAGARSPDWLCERLRRVGLRPIHPVVDVTNYVMLELGQPLHAYSLDRLTGRIIVRSAGQDERLTLLDGTQIVLDDDALVIADESGAIGLAGIMGGAGTAVDAATQHVFLESAHFTPEAILGRARRYGLQTDASMRFERGVDPAGPVPAIERATELLQAIAGGDAGPVQVTESPAHLPGAEPVRLRLSRLETLLGMRLQAGEVEAQLRRLVMHVQPEDDGWSVVPPSFRFDIAIEEDLVEEVGRMVGYDNVPVTPGASSIQLGTATEQRVDGDAVSDLLVARGYAEVVTYAFIDERANRAIDADAVAVRLANPLSSDMKVMRSTLWPSLLDAARRNMARQQPGLRIFEIGAEFADEPDNISETAVLAGLAIGRQWPEHWDLDARDVDFFDIKADIEAVLELTRRAAEVRFEAGAHAALHPGQTARILAGNETAGWLGSLHPRLLRHFDLKRTPILFSLELDAVLDAAVPAASPVSKFPSVRRDIAVIVPENVTVQSLVNAARSAAGESLESVAVFDLYRDERIGTGRKSVALGLILQSQSRTLAVGDADATLQSVAQCLEKEFGAQIRTERADSGS